jgi:hypothetical protein
MVKRRQVLSSPTHLVEIDLRRGGTRASAPELPPRDLDIECSVGATSTLFLFGNYMKVSDPNSEGANAPTLPRSALHLPLR